MSRWGIYRWFVKEGKAKIHEEDFEKFQKNINNVCIVECIDKIDDFLIIKYNYSIYRVKGELSLELPEPKFKFGDSVIHKNKENKFIKGVIADTMWHSDKKSNYYFLTIDGKKKSRRYFDNELEKI